MDGRVTVVGSAFVIASFWLLSLALPCAAQSNDPVGSEWIYSFQEEYFGVVDFTGTWTYSCERIVDSPLGDTQQKVAEYHSRLIAFNSPSGSYSHPNYNWTMIFSGSQYYDIETSEMVGIVSNEHVEEQYGSGNSTVEYSYDERNETLCIPPGGSGVEPENIEAGDAWTKIYTKVSNVSGFEDGIYFAKQFTWTETLEYKYIGYETVSVPAGVFSCNKFEITSSDGDTETAWWARNISAYAKIEDAYGSHDVMTYELASYHLESGSGGGTVKMGPDLFIAAFFISIAATAVAAAYASSIVKERDRHPRKEYEENAPRPPDWY